MGTKIRPQVSKKNDYWISKHRYYELLHWCRQYDEWIRDRYIILTSMNSPNIDEVRVKGHSSPVEKATIDLEKLNKKIRLLEDSAMEAAPDIASYIIFSVSKGKGFTYLKEVKDIPCSKNYYYDRYRKFFWILHNKFN